MASEQQPCTMSKTGACTFQGKEHTCSLCSLPSLGLGPCHRCTGCRAQVSRAQAVSWQVVMVCAAAQGCETPAGAANHSVHALSEWGWARW